VRLRSPAGAWMLARMLAWRVALPVLKRALPLPRLVRLAATPRRRHRFTPAQVVVASHRLFGVRTPASSDCLDRSLLTYRFLAEAGAEPQLVCGLRYSGEDVVGHSWVVLGGAPVDEAPDALARYSAVLAFDASGARL
jgi:Transglutaminase-like superfamily